MDIRLLRILILVPFLLTVASTPILSKGHAIGAQNHQAGLRSNDEPPEVTPATSTDTIHVMWIGLDGGMHFKNHTTGASGFGEGVQVRLTFFELPFSEEVRLSLAIRYWHATRAQEPYSSVDSKGLEISFPFGFAAFGNTALCIVPSVGFEGVSNNTGTIGSLGIAAMAIQTLMTNKLELRLQAFLRTGGRLVDVGGGGLAYTMFGFSLGVYTNLASFVTMRH